MRFEYCCLDCGLQDAAVIVPRRAKGEDPSVWFTFILAPAVSIDHAQKSPTCAAWPTPERR